VGSESFVGLQVRRWQRGGERPQIVGAAWEGHGCKLAQRHSFIVLGHNGPSGTALHCTVVHSTLPYCAILHLRRTETLVLHNPHDTVGVSLGVTCRTSCAVCGALLSRARGTGRGHLWQGLQLERVASRRRLRGPG